VIASLLTFLDWRRAEETELISKWRFDPLSHLVEKEPAHGHHHPTCGERQPGRPVERREESYPCENDHPTGDNHAGAHEFRKSADGFIDFWRTALPSLVTEYEQLLSEMLQERKERLETLKAGGEKNKKKIDALLSEVGFVEGELQRYQRGLKLFRSKGLPKVGRWGKPEATQHGEAKDS
jgi:hypothetical protein